LKTLFGTATIYDIQELHSIFDDLQTKNADIVHSLENQLSYVKRLDKMTAINADAIANLSSIVKDNTIQSHDKFQQITRDIMWLNVTIYGQSEICMAVTQLEFALLQLTQQVDDLFIAIQCAIQGNLSVKLTDPFTLQNILMNVILQLPDGYKLVLSTKTENIHQYYFVSKNGEYLEQKINLHINVIPKTYETGYEMPCTSIVRDRRKCRDLDVGW